MSAVLTLGPWTASIEPKSFSSGGHWYVIIDDEENGLGEFYGDDHEANVANARMAAAAPELFQALEDIVTGCTVLHPNHMPNAVKNARAALAKARGEA